MKKWMDKIKKNDKGFTLVELIVVIAVLAIITIVAAPAYVKYVEKARIGTDENAIGEIAHIAEVEYVALEAQGKISGSVKIKVTCGNDAVGIPGRPGYVAASELYSVVTNDGREDSASGILAAAVNQMIGEYEVKSNTYKHKPVVITVDGSGNATWNKEAYND